MVSYHLIQGLFKNFMHSESFASRHAHRPSELFIRNDLICMFRQSSFVVMGLRGSGHVHGELF